jgi:hypothetical protein
MVHSPFAGSFKNMAATGRLPVPARWRKIQEFRTIVSEQSDQALSWCKSQVHMFEGNLIGFDKLGAHHEAHRI